MIPETKNINKLDTALVRKDFPILSSTVNGKPLIYFDSGATSQKPQQVIDSISEYYAAQNANIHRGVHTLSQEVTLAYENARTSVQKYIHAGHPHEIIFTSGTTESISLVAAGFAKKFIHPGDEILLSEMEHHSNILPWQQVCEERNAMLKVIPVNDEGELKMDAYRRLLGSKTKIVAIAHVSNTLGTINPLNEMIKLAHEKNIPVLVDGAQAIPHMKVDVQELDADFYAFSGHKVYGPTGIGVLYGKEKWLKMLPNYKVGGGTIKTVSFTKTEYADLPLRFEAGTPHIEGAIGLAAALEYMDRTGIENIMEHEHELLVYATQKLSAVPGLKVIGTAKQKAGVISFIVGDLHPYDIGMLLDAQGIAVRTGHHCTQPLMERYGIKGTVRVSLAMYNTKEEIDQLLTALEKSIRRLSQTK